MNHSLNFDILYVAASVLPQEFENLEDENLKLREELNASKEKAAPQ